MYTTARHHLLRWVLDAFGFGAVNEAEMGALATFAALYSTLLGYLSHEIMGDRAFGRSLNGMISFSGACLSLVGYAHCGGRIAAGRFDVALILVATCSAGVLILCALVKCVVLPQIGLLLFDRRSGETAKPTHMAAIRPSSIPAGRLRL